MIIVKLTGGLGNQLFGYAMGVNLSRKFNTELKFDVSEYLGYAFLQRHHYEWNYGLNNFCVNLNASNIVDPEKLRYDPKNKVIYFEDRPFQIFVENPRVFMEGIFDLKGKNVYFDGYWQSEKYFVDSADEVRRAFNLKKKLEITSTYWKEKILAEECPVSLHIRRSSYNRPNFRTHSGLLSPLYYRECVQELKKYVSNFKIFVFTQEIGWARKNLKLDVPVEYVTGCEQDVDEIYLMSLCKHNIVANSTFSWWGAWLNQNPDKKIFAPKLWHLSHWGGDFLVPKNWLRVPSHFEKFPPLLSIIVFVENDLSTIGILMSSLSTLIFNDFEVLIVTKDGDQSGLFCRRYSTNTNVTIMTIDENADKMAAWNKGLQSARGEYVLFLTGNETILPRTVRLCAESFDFGTLKFSSRDNYMTDEHYDEIGYDVICASRVLVENPAGDLDLNLSGGARKCMLKVNAQLSNVTDNFIELENKAGNRLDFAKFQATEALISSKIFKRKFLERYNLQFQENFSMAESLFVFNTLLLARNIVVASEIFLIQLNPE